MSAAGTMHQMMTEGRGEVKALAGRLSRQAASSAVGPLWQRLVEGEHEYALVTGQAPQPPRPGAGRRADDVGGPHLRHDGAIRLGKPTLATLQLDTHFVEAGKIGEILVSKPHVVRSTRSLIFITTEVTVDKRCIAMASGVFKILKSE